MFCCLAYNGTVVAGDSASSHLRLSPAHVKKIKCYLICGKATATRTILYTARHVSGLRARFCSSPSPTTRGLSQNVGLCRSAHHFVTLFWLCRRSDKCSRLLHGTMGLGMALPNPSFFFLPLSGLKGFCPRRSTLSAKMRVRSRHT